MALKVYVDPKRIKRPLLSGGYGHTVEGENSVLGSTPMDPDSKPDGRVGGWLDLTNVTGRREVR
jgi:hypothetical protein